jgi:hypothetical protein
MAFPDLGTQFVVHDAPPTISSEEIGVTGRSVSVRAPRSLMILALLATLPLACAARIGKNAAAGAMAEMRQQSAKGAPPASVAAENAVAGAMAAFDTPEQQARIQRLVEKAAAGATAALEDPEQQARMQRMVSETVAAMTRTAVGDASDQLVTELGADGSGPLAVSLSRTGERVSASVAGGMVGGVVGGVGNQLAALVPECTGPNRAACLEQRLQETTRTTAATFSKGVRDSLGWQLLLVAFALGIGGGAFGSWLWSLRHERRSFRTA